MADLRDEHRNPIQLTDQYGHPVQLTDEYGHPMHLTGAATTAGCTAPTVYPTSTGVSSAGENFPQTASYGASTIGEKLSHTAGVGAPTIGERLHQKTESEQQKELHRSSSSSSSSISDLAMVRSKKQLSITTIAWNQETIYAWMGQLQLKQQKACKKHRLHFRLGMLEMALDSNGFCWEKPFCR